MSHFIDLRIVPRPFVSVVTSKYQIATDAPIINWVQPIRNEFTQTNPKA